ncbi:alpha/beta-hydrolase [Aspergillus sclerotiicarbonarius CBS 121057]|uniref:Alpha/beta-hydrolase n=1 Tax=Aspergillus sclerotiicarbonarius (strain CBS 121057 / IBT 28362) TaxID=1448318 RepID=A0A319E406_ASPSB|nr:alpha/beta-hydrolase [Aspergillus sclerotiicarbonarius CBS 121057]
MASVAFPTQAKKATLSDGTTYGYVAIPASAGNATFLLLHGYPSTSYDWRHQIAALQQAGYGVIAPDLLGYGDTDKPTDLKAYRLKVMSSHMVEILDLEKVSRAVLVAHDWGVGLASRLAFYHGNRFYGLVTMAVSYTAPGGKFDLDAVLERTKAAFGYETHGYWLWHNSDEAAAEIEANPESMFGLIFPQDPLLWKSDICPRDKAAEWVRAGRTAPLASWLTPEDRDMHHQVFSKGGYSGPLSWYKAMIRGFNNEDEAGIAAGEGKCPVRNLFIAAKQDYICRAEMGTMMTNMNAPDSRIEAVDCGHWVQLEEPEVVNKLLIGFAKEVVN